MEEVDAKVLQPPEGREVVGGARKKQCQLRVTGISSRQSVASLSAATKATNRHFLAILFRQHKKLPNEY